MMKKTSFYTSVSLIFMVTAETYNPIFPNLPVTVLQTNNSECKRHSEMYIKSLTNFTLWAYEMWDATAKSTTGVLRGNYFHLGDFEQCITTEAPFLTKYCLAFLKASIPQLNNSRDPLSLYHHPNEYVLQRLYPYNDVSQQKRNFAQIGWCIPASCSSEDLQTFLNSYVKETVISLLPENVTYQAQIKELTCNTKEDYNSNFNTADICFCSLTLALILMTLVATIFDFLITETEDTKSKQKPILYRLFISFSGRKNFKDLTRKDESNDALSVLYGLRTICIFFIIMDHRFGTFISSALMNFNYIEQEYRSPFASLLFHGDLFVDTFFIMGGLLVTFGLLNQLDKRRINPGFVILMRYIRLTPVYAFVIFYYATVFNYTGTGPFWKVIAGQESQDCKDNWWTNLLYINNYVNADHLCMTHSWYLPCDLHFFIIATGICLLLKKERKLGLAILLLLTIISLIIPFALTIIYHRPALLHFYPDFLTAPKVHPDFLLTYIKSHTRAISYCIGMFVGYIYYKLQGKDIHISKNKSYCLWFILIIFIASSLLGGAVFYDPYHKYNAIESALYAALHRPAFDFATVTIIYLCSYGHAAFLRKILTWSPWVPLSKLVYGAYLVHMQFQLRYASIFMSPRYFTYFDVINLALADMILSFVTALVLYLLIEAPFKNIFKEILMPKRISHHKNNTDDQENVRNGSCDSKL